MIDIVLGIAHHPNGGARGNGIIEHEWSELVTSMCAKILGVTYSVEVLDHGPAKNDPQTVWYQVGRVNALRPRLALQIHCNAARNSSATGHETLCFGSKKSLKLAAAVHSDLDRYCGVHWPDRGVKVRRDLAFLRATSCPALIIEPFFLSSPEQAAWADLSKSVLGVAVHIAASVDKYLKIQEYH